MEEFCKGIDIYHEDAEPDFRALIKEGISFVYHKIGQGNTPDPAFTSRYKKCKEVGITFGGFWFYDTRVSPITQADICLKTMSPDSKNLPYALDIEANFANISPEQFAKDIHLWLLKIEHESGKPPIIYTRASFWNEQIPRVSAVYLGKHYDLWVSHYTRSKSPRIPLGWKDWAIWQWAAGESSKPTVPFDIPVVGGGRKPVDSNYFKGSHDDLLKRFKIV